MTKRLMAKVGEYQKDGQTKGEYVEIGVILSNNNGEYAILHPSVSLSGVLMQQRLLAQKNGSKAGDRVMVGIFENDRNGGNRQQGGGGNQNSGGSGRSDFDDEIPF